MIQKVFSVYDGKSQSYGVPFFMPAVGLAVRAFGDLANDPQSTVCKHSADFVLFEIGEFDDQSGKVTALQEHINLGVASGYKKVVNYVPDSPMGLPSNGNLVKEVVR